MENPLFKNQEKQIDKSLEITPHSLLTEKKILDKVVRKHYMEATQDYLILTVENIKAFSLCLESRIDYYKSKGISNPVIVEVGAGNGRLSHFLEEKLKQDNYIYDIIPTDNFSWEKTAKEKIQPHFNVAPYNHKESANLFNPTIVICSMMTPDGDLSKVFRSNQNVQEYILLGHRIGTGHDWETHGENYFSVKDEGSTPDFIKGGFERLEIDEVSKHLIQCESVRNSTPSNEDEESIKHGKTYRCDSFRRITLDTEKDLTSNLN